MARQWNSHFFDTLSGAFANLLWHDYEQQFAPQKAINGAGLTLSPAMATITEVVGSDTYICEAPAGTAATDGGWRIQKVNVTGAVTSITWANGGKFDQVAANRKTLTYA